MIELDLRDIHIPETVPWWPLAPGWWLLILLLISVAVGLYWAWRARRQPLKRQALRELGKIRRHFEGGAATSRILADVGVLVRRTAISRSGRETVAGLSGDAWRERIVAMSAEPAFDAGQLELLSRGRYQRNPPADVDALLAACERWLRSLPRS